MASSGESEAVEPGVSMAFLASYDRDDPEQFWLHYTAAADAIQQRVGWKLTDRDLNLLAGPDGLGETAWLAQRLTDQQRNSLLAVARAFDAFPQQHQRRRYSDCWSA